MRDTNESKEYLNDLMEFSGGKRSGNVDARKVDNCVDKFVIRLKKKIGFVCTLIMCKNFLYGPVFIRFILSFPNSRCFVYRVSLFPIIEWILKMIYEAQRN